MATRPDKMVGMPMRMVLFWAREMKGALKAAVVTAEAPNLSSLRRWA